MRRKIIFAAIAGLLVGFGLLGARRAEAAPPRPNILFIQLDTVRYDHTSLAGYRRSTTPYLASLAKRGISFTRCESTSTWCVPGTVSLLTGLTPTHHGVVNKVAFPDGTVGHPKAMRLADSVPILPTLLRARGYKVAAFTGQQTIDSFDDLGRRLDLFPTGTKLSRFAESMSKALAWLRARQAKGEPFFMFLHAYDPHGATEPTGGYSRVYDTGYTGRLQPRAADYIRLRDEAWANKEKEGRFVVTSTDARDRAFVTALYDERLRCTDRQLERFLGAVERMGLLRSTIVVIVSDHGEEMFDRGAICHGHSLYEELLHVPLVMLFPGERGGRRIDALVRNIDALPTALARAGVTTPKIDGVSLLPLLAGRPMTLVVRPETDFLMLTKKRAVRTDRYKLVRTSESGTFELYDLTVDPGERRDLAAKRPDLVRALEKLLGP